METRLDVQLFADSGEEKSDDPLVAFVYDLLRDHIPSGTVQKILKEVPVKTETVYSNGFLAREAKWIVARLAERRKEESDD